MSLALLFHHLLLSMFRMLVHPSSGACDLLWIYFMCCIALVRCVLVLWCGSSGVVWYPYAGWGNATISRKLLKKDVLTLETCWAVNIEIIKQVTQVGLSLFNYKDDARSSKLKILWMFAAFMCFVREWIRFKHTDMSRCDSSSSLLFLFKASADKLCSIIITVSAFLYNTT